MNRRDAIRGLAAAGALGSIETTTRSSEPEAPSAAIERDGLKFGSSG